MTTTSELQKNMTLEFDQLFVIFGFRLLNIDEQEIVNLKSGSSLVNALKGSISSSNPSAEKTLQGCFSIMGFNFGSTLIKCSKASSRIFVVVVVTFGAFDGETSSKGLFAIRRWVSGVTKEAFVPPGRARRPTGGGGVLSSMSPEL